MRVTATMERRQKMTTGTGNVTKDIQETHRNRHEGLNGSQEIIERQT
jgi:hypothetical protein